MSHELVGARFVARGVPGWHNIGRVAKKDEKATASQWVAEVTKDAEVVKLPLTYELDGKHYVSDQVAIVRKPMADDPEPRQFGIAAASWNLQSYAACARVFDKLSETYPVETAGLIKDGALCFVSFKAETWDVLGDQITSYITVVISMKPGVCHHILHSPVRVVCNNTLTMAGEQASINIRVPHEADSMQQLELAATIIAKFQEAKEETKKVFTAMAKRSLRVDEAMRIIEAAYPMPSMPARLRMMQQLPDDDTRSKYKKDLDPNQMAALALAESNFKNMLQKTQQIRDLAAERYAKFDRKDLRGTAWAAYNAVTEVSDWREGRNADESLMFGSRAQEKARAFEAAASLLNDLRGD